MSKQRFHEQAGGYQVRNPEGEGERPSDVLSAARRITGALPLRLTGTGESVEATLSS